MTVSLDFSELVRKLNNAVEYSTGFVMAIEQERLAFNMKLGEVIKQMLEKYVDSQASLSPERLHHVYEWGQAGDPSARLFDFNMVATATHITLHSTFRQSQSASPSGGAPFADKATVMESGASITITPKDSGVIAFDVDGETIFTSSEVFVEHPGGPEVAGAFKATIEGFLVGYVKPEVILPIFRSMSTAREFKQYFPAGVNGGGFNTGQKAGRQYMKIKGGLDVN